MVPPLFRNSKNKDGKTPYEIFSENNKELVSKGLKWTKDCMVVATLIITVAFAVAFTVPGGYNQETGIPIFDHDASFLVFIIYGRCIFLIYFILFLYKFRAKCSLFLIQLFNKITISICYNHHGIRAKRSSIIIYPLNTTNCIT